MHRTRDKMTKGLNHTLEKSDPNYHNYRFVFFETDKPYVQEDYNRIIKTYESHNLDLLVHNSGGGGQHFISPTVVIKKEWKEIMIELKDINPMFPRLCLRWIPNKYVDEDKIWYRACVGYSHPLNFLTNSKELCNLLNKAFGSDFKGLLNTQLKIRKYPLPCVYCNKQIRGNHVCLT